MKIDFNIQQLIEERIGKITPAKVFLGLAFFIIAVNLLGLVLSIFNALLPFAILAIIAYYGYQFLQSTRGQEMVQKMTTTATNARKETVAPVIKGEQVRARAQTADVKASAKIETSAARLDDIMAEAEVEEAPVEEAVDAASERLTVPEKVNPVTGLKEPDMERLMEKEQEPVQEAKNNADAIKAQLEERKKRLKGG